MLKGDYLFNGYVWGETLWERCRICLKGIISSMDKYGERHCGKGVEYARRGLSLPGICMGRDTVEKVLNMLKGDYLFNGYVWGETLWKRC